MSAEHGPNGSRFSAIVARRTRAMGIDVSDAVGLDFGISKR
jgi:hypothetical protein